MVVLTRWLRDAIVSINENPYPVVGAFRCCQYFNLVPRVSLLPARKKRDTGNEVDSWASLSDPCTVG